MRTIFNSVPAKIPKRNRFNLSHQVKTTFEMGQLVPFFCEPVLPNDRFKIKTAQLVRFAPLLAPIMSNVDVYIHFFFVPTRLVWDKWEDFITQSINGKQVDSSLLPIYPTITYTSNDDVSKIGSKSLADYLGFQPVKGKIATKYELDQLPFRVYQRIWFDYYRDENLSNLNDFQFSSYSGNVNVSDTPTSYDGDFETELMTLKRRAWKKDYFTSALPFPQKGDSVYLPFGEIEVNGDGTVIKLSEDSKVAQGFKGYAVNGTINPPADIVLSSPISGNLNNPSNFVLGASSSTGSNTAIIEGINPNKYGVNSQQMAQHLTVEGAPIATITELRRAYAAQRFLERKALGGSRYQEQNFAFFGIKGKDSRLQRAEFLGGMKSPVVVSQVLQTSSTTTNTPDSSPSPLGQPAGNAVSAGSKYIFDRTFSEYGYIMGIISVIPKADYTQGVPKKYLKRDVYDFYWPQFAKIGEQPIERQELFYDTTNYSRNKETFGYTPRYAEYRFINNKVNGDFRDTLSFWTLARNFNQTQFLNESFITCNPSNDIFAVRDTQFSHLWCLIDINCKTLRPITKYGEAY